MNSTVTAELKIALDKEFKNYFDLLASDVPMDEKNRDVWTIRQIIEHVYLTSHFLMIIIKNGTRKSLSVQDFVPDENYAIDWEKLKNVGTHKSFAWKHPEHMTPDKNLPATFLPFLLKEQKSTLEFILDLLKNGQGAACLTTMTVDGIGKIDVYHYIAFLILHMHRHLEQIQKHEFFTLTHSIENRL